MKNIATIFYFIFCAVFVAGCQSKEAKAANRIFGNMTYLTNSPYIAEKVTLVNGYRETRNFRLHHSMYYEGQYVYGDFNHDGLKDAAVIITQGEGASGDFRELAFLINDGQNFVHRVSHSLGDGVIINSLKEHDGKVIVDMCVHGEHDCMAGPTKRVKNVYDYLRPKLTLVSGNVSK